MLLRHISSLGLASLLCLSASAGAQSLTVSASDEASVSPEPPRLDSQSSEDSGKNAGHDTAQGPAATPSNVGSFETGLRLGVGLGLGGAGRSLDGTARGIDDIVSVRVPLWLDLNYRHSETLTLGLYGQFGLGSVGSSCRGACNWSELRAGVQGQWLLSTSTSSRPWVGVGLGYQWLTLRTNTQLPLEDFVDLRDIGLDPVDDADETLVLQRTEDWHGPELLLQGGLDFALSEGLAAGPYISATLSHYLGNTRSCSDTGATRFLTDEEACPAVRSGGAMFHTWLSVGLRGSFAP